MHLWEILGFQQWILPVAIIKLACPLVIPRKHGLLRVKGYLNLPVCLLVYAMLGQPFLDLWNTYFQGDTCGISG